VTPTGGTVATAGAGVTTRAVTLAVAPSVPTSTQHDGRAACHPFLQQSCAPAFPLSAAGIMQIPFVEPVKKVSAKRKTVARRCSRKDDMTR
jgi:hypothetical protein